MLFSGDHIMEGSTVVIAPPDGDMATYLHSLERLAGWRPKLRSIAPGHGHLIEAPQAKIEEYISHRLAREAQVLDALKAARTTTIDAIVQQLYADLPDAPPPVAPPSVWAHLLPLVDHGKAAGSPMNGLWSPT